MSLTAGTAFTVNTSSTTDVIGLTMNYVGNIIYALTGYAPDTVGISVLIFLLGAFVFALAIVGKLMTSARPKVK